MGLVQKLICRKALICLFVIILSLDISSANANIENNIDARRFLSSYCITLVNEIEKSYQNQVVFLKSHNFSLKSHICYQDLIFLY